MTPLDTILRQLIAESGPLRIDEFMNLALAHPAHGYYMTRDPLGRGGDFTTAPEISQMFGELLGLWAADVWQKLGSPPRFQFVECGPGRGTLMADALRAGAKVPGFLEAAQIVLMEISPVLKEKQRAALAAYNVEWVDALDHAPVGSSGLPIILLANEFLDALPVRQFVFRARDWFERCVTIDTSDALAFTEHPCAGRDSGDWARSRLSTLDPGLRRDAEIIELAQEREAFVAQTGKLLEHRRGAALFLDYGYRGPAVGDTLQAMQNQTFVSPLVAVGEADLTAHVDFGALAVAGAVAVHGPTDQGLFLRRLGIEARVAALRPRRPEAIDAALHRLTHPSAMGQLFQVMAFSHGLAASPEGF